MFARLAFLLTLFYVTILLTQPQNRFIFLHPFRIANLAMVIAIGCHIMSVLAENRPLIRLGPATRVSLALIFFGLIAQYFGALQPDTSWNGEIDNLIKVCVVAIMIEVTCTSIQRVWAVQATVLLSALWWLKAGVRLSAAGVTYGGGDRIMGPGVSIVDNPNTFAYLLGLIIPVYLYFYHQSPQKYMKLLYLFGALVGVYSAINTGSRTGIIVLSVMGLFLIWRYARKQIVSLIVIVVAGYTILGMTGQMNIERFKTIPDSMRSFFAREDVSLEQAQGADEHSAIERRLKNRDTWALIKEYPIFGIGMMPSESLYGDRFPFARGFVHNEMLKAGKQMGVIGMGLYLSIIFILMRNGHWVQRKAGTWWPSLADLGWTFKLQGLVILVGGQFATQPWNPFFFVLAGAASALWPLVQADYEARFGYAAQTASSTPAHAAPAQVPT